MKPKTIEEQIAEELARYEDEDERALDESTCPECGGCGGGEFHCYTCSGTGERCAM